MAAGFVVVVVVVPNRSWACAAGGRPAASAAPATTPATHRTPPTMCSLPRFAPPNARAGRAGPSPTGEWNTRRSEWGDEIVRPGEGNAIELLANGGGGQNGDGSDRLVSRGCRSNQAGRRQSATAEWYR